MFMRIAASTYLNSAPLVYSFTQGFLRKSYDFIGDEAPSRCAEMLRAGECEIALIPVIELQRIPGLRIVPEIAVASKKRVRSVLIASRRPLEEVRRLTLDPASRTSQTLVKILFLRRYGFLPECAERAMGPLVEVRNLVDDLIAAKREGVDHIEQIATQYTSELELPRSELLDYLSQNVNYDLDDENLRGMDAYFDLAHECGLIAQKRPMLFL